MDHWLLNSGLSAPAINRIKKPKRAHMDFESYSDVNLLEVGSSRYSRHPSTEVLMLAYSFGDDDVRQWVPAENGDPVPFEFEDALLDERVEKWAWNAPFERSILRNVMGYTDEQLDPHAWRDAMVLAYTLSFPGTLEKAGEIVGLAEDKKKSARGKALIRLFSMPRKPTKANPLTRANFITNPTEWEEYKAYNRQDVVAERSFLAKTWRWNLPQHEWDLWALDQEINLAGLPVNMKAVHNIQKVAHDIVRGYLDEMAEITDLDNPNSTQQLLPWLQEQGYVFDDLKKGHVERALNEEPADTDLSRVLFLRARTAKASVKKYNALASATDDDGYLRYHLQFAGAQRTWRWSGRKFQTQNLSRPHPKYSKHVQQIEAIKLLETISAEEMKLIYGDDSMDVLATCVRPVIQAPDGYTFCICDLNAIENRVLGYIAQDPKILSVFEMGRDPYIDFARYMYGTTYDIEWARYDEEGNKDHRTIAKPGVLGCGYMLSAGHSFENRKTGEIEATGLLGYAWNMGVRNFTQIDSDKSVKVWRETYERAVDYWFEIDRAMQKAIRTGNRVDCWPIWFDTLGPMLRMHLPSGRSLHYVRATIKDKMKPWGRMGPTIVYEGLNERKQWTEIDTHPGKITENADQAISRDLLAHGMKLARIRMNLDGDRFIRLTRLHAHDELVVMVKEDEAEKQFAILRECMTEPPDWAPDIPLGAEGFISKFYVKDQ